MIYSLTALRFSWYLPLQIISLLHTVLHRLEGKTQVQPCQFGSSPPQGLLGPGRVLHTLRAAAAG